MLFNSAVIGPDKMKYLLGCGCGWSRRRRRRRCGRVGMGDGRTIWSINGYLGNIRPLDTGISRCRRRCNRRGGGRRHHRREILARSRRNIGVGAASDCPIPEE